MTNANLTSWALLLFCTGLLQAQDTHYPPKNQLIPAPECLTQNAVREGGFTPCTAAAHDEWLKDVTHWRFERSIRSMPGGLEGVRQMIRDFHSHGVRVLFPMMMWDQGTRGSGIPWPQAIANLMKEIDADGVNGDTQDGVPLAFFEAAEKVDHPL